MPRYSSTRLQRNPQARKIGWTELISKIPIASYGPDMLPVHQIIPMRRTHAASQISDRILWTGHDSGPSGYSDAPNPRRVTNFRLHPLDRTCFRSIRLFRSGNIPNSPEATDTCPMQAAIPEYRLDRNIAWNDRANPQSVRYSWVLLYLDRPSGWYGLTSKILNGTVFRQALNNIFLT